MTTPGKDAPSPDAEWPAKVAGAVESLADLVRSKAVHPLEKAARAIVFGVVAAVLGLMVVILVSVGVIRVLNVYLFPGQEWASYTIAGGIFLGAGVFLFLRKRPKTSRGE
ncbi:MAG: phage holin family protein [Acidimicrobiales bacterium]